jgi:phospholipid/cholesterol/gamma-HCH transport system ATP-binding protein
VTTPVLELEHATKSFEDHLVLNDFELRVREGETFSVLGGSGSGKSVMLKLLIGLLRLDSGCVRFRGREVTDLSERHWIEVRKRFGMVFQGAALFDSMTVLENVAYPMREHTDWDEDRIRRRVAEKLALVGLRDIDDKLPAELSGGMRKRVGVARAVALDPEVILYDEPTTGLDPANARRVARLIRELQRELRVTSVVVTHDLGLCFEVSDRIGLLKQGRLVAVETRERFRRSDDPDVREFLEGSLP